MGFRNEWHDAKKRREETLAARRRCTGENIHIYVYRPNSLWEEIKRKERRYVLTLDNMADVETPTHLRHTSPKPKDFHGDEFSDRRSPDDNKRTIDTQLSETQDS